MRNRKAVLAEGVIFWMIYIAMTGVVIFLIRAIPSTVYSQATETFGMENAVLTDRVYNEVAWESPLTQREYIGELPKLSDWDTKRINSAFDTLGAPRQLSFKLTLEGKEAYYDEAFYKRAKPLSPVRYKSFVETRPVWIVEDKKIATLEIDQVFAPVPPGGMV